MRWAKNKVVKATTETLPAARYSDADLLARHAQGDSEAFRSLFERYRHMVYGYLCKCGVSAHTRDDLAQEAFVKIHKAASTYQPRRPVKAWIFTIVANTVRSHFRKQSVWRRVFLRTSEWFDPPSESPDLSLVVGAEQSAMWLHEQIAQLPLAQRQALLLHTVEGLEYQEVADTLGVPIGTVKTYIRRARLHLAKAWARREHVAKREVSS